METPESIKKFYHSKRWKQVRQIVLLKYNGRCCECGKVGSEVHHKIPLTVKNVSNPVVALGIENLELLCSECHNSKRSENKQVRKDLMFDENGDMVQR